MYQPYVDLIAAFTAQETGNLQRMQNAWLSRLAHNRQLLKHSSTDSLFVSFGGPLTDVVICWKVCQVGEMYELSYADKDRQVALALRWLAGG